jgi:hypothetical protein
MLDDWLLSLLYAAWLTASTMPLGFMLGSSCSPCCGGCGVADGKPRTDPVNEGTWTPSGTWRGVGGVTWTFTANPGDDSGETWFFYGSASTSKVGGGASQSEQRDWFNICNWYSNKTTSPSTTSGLPGAFDKRATRLPPSDAVVHIYSDVSTTTTGPVTVKNAYFWSNALFLASSELTASSAAFDSAGGSVFNNSSENYGATINGGATFNNTSQNFEATVNDGATFNNSSQNFSNAFLLFVRATINGGATFNDLSQNDRSTVNGGATFNDSSENIAAAIVNDAATFNDSSRNLISTVNGGATFNDLSQNAFGIVNGGATFNDSSKNDANGTVDGGATFNDTACSQRTRNSFFNCPGLFRRRFVAHPTDLPTCNGTAPDGCANAADTCGCN